MRQGHLDPFDIAILNLVQRNNQLTSEQLAEQVKLSPSAIQRRLKRLRREGVIEAEIAVVSLEAVGRHLMMIVEVELERERPHLLDEFKQLMRDTPEVMQCYYVTGNADFILIVTVKDMQEYEAFTQRFFFKHANIKRFHTNVVMNRVKTGLTVPLDPN